ncbi:unnamed protein product [Moneuplotes crassus]|uniref:Uncharacterized protein n=1 Tax=Euplotes crassus TaxID=5936 RepID=A0AAD2D3Z3_EUPCR|nr:unnamed protein product [Moneuplotes crassus]
MCSDDVPCPFMYRCCNGNCLHVSLACIVVRRRPITGLQIMLIVLASIAFMMICSSLFVTICRGGRRRAGGPRGYYERTTNLEDSPERIEYRYIGYPNDQNQADRQQQLLNVNDQEIQAPSQKEFYPKSPEPIQSQIPNTAPQEEPESLMIKRKESEVPSKDEEPDSPSDRKEFVPESTQESKSGLFSGPDARSSLASEDSSQIHQDGKNGIKTGIN